MELFKTLDELEEMSTSVLSSVQNTSGLMSGIIESGKTKEIFRYFTVLGKYIVFLINKNSKIAIFIRYLFKKKF